MERLECGHFFKLDNEVGMFMLGRNVSGFGNDYSFLEDAHSKNQPDAHVSVVIPVYNRIEMLRRTIAMLTHSTYPLELIEVVIADDGSSDLSLIHI